MSDIEYLIFDDALRDLDTRAIFDRGVQGIIDGTLPAQKLSRAPGFVVDTQAILGTALLEYAIGIIPAAEFNAEQARTISERMRMLLGWHEISYTLRLWVEKRLCKPYFKNLGSEWNQDWQLRSEADASHLPESFYQFACYIAIGELKYGPSYASVSAERIFDWVTKLGNDLPAKLKKFGTGELPAELAEFRGEDAALGVTAKANDALAVIRVTVKSENEESYAAVLEYLIRLLETTDFPRSFAIEFRGPTKQYLPIKGLPKKGVHQLIACAAEYPALSPLIERYARTAMREYEWYTNLDDVNCAMPGTFAVFALGISAESHGQAETAALVRDYLHEVDGEHQSMQQHFVEAYLDRYGFDERGVSYLLACAGNIQHLRHRKTHPAMIANAQSLAALLALRPGHAAGSAETSDQVVSGVAALSANMLGQPVEDYAWRHALFAIWGAAAEQRDSSGQLGAKIIAAAPSTLQPLYRAVFD